MSDGKIDLLTKDLTCFQNPLYFILKNSNLNNLKTYNIFPRNVTFQFEFLDGVFNNVNFTTNEMHKDLFKIKYIKGKGRAFFDSEIVPKLLEGNIVPFQTFPERVPFFKPAYSSSNYPYDERIDQPGHVFVAIGVEGQQLIYAEAPWYVSNHFIPYKDSKELGVIDLLDMEAAFDCYLNYMDISIKGENLQTVVSGDRNIEILKKIYEEFWTKKHTNLNTEYYYNVEGIKQFIFHCEQNSFRLQDKVIHCNANYCKLLEWKFEEIRMSKSLLFQSLYNSSNQLNQIITPLQKSLSEWTIIINLLRKMIVRGEYLPATTLTTQLINIQNSETEFYYALDYFFKGNEIYRSHHPM